MPSRKFTGEVELEICKKYESGTNSPELARKYNSNSTTIRDILKRNNIDRRTKGEMSKKFTDEQEKEICIKYQNGKSSVKLGKEYNCHHVIICRILKRNNINRKINNEQELEICKKYKRGISCTKLCKEYKKNYNTISDILKKNNIIIINQRSKKYELDESYFDVVDTEDKAYFLGWLYADGCNSETEKSISIGLEETDKYILEVFKYFLKTNKSLYYKPEQIMKDKEGNIQYRKTDGLPMISKPQYVLSINNKYMSESLTKLGCVQKKSLILKFPTEDQVPEHLLPHFIRGYMEGDGHVGFNNKCTPRLEIVGTKEFLESLQKYLLKQGIKLNLHNKTKLLFTLTISKIEMVLRFKKLIYGYITNSKLILKRKYNKFVEIHNYAIKNKEQIKHNYYVNVILKKPKNIQRIKDMYHLEGKTHKEIATLLNISKGYVRNIINS